MILAVIVRSKQLLIGLPCSLVLVLQMSVAQSDSNADIVVRLGNASSVLAVAFSPDMKCVLSGSADGKLRLWDLSGGSPCRLLAGHAAPITSVAFSPNGEYAMSSSEDKTLKLWEIGGGKDIRTFRAHTGPVNSAAFAPDGKQIWSGGEDGTLRLWEVSRDAPLKTVKEDSVPITQVVVSPDGSYLLSIGGSGYTRLHDLSNQDQVIDSLAFTLLRRTDSVTVAMRIGYNCMALSLDGTTAAFGSPFGPVFYHLRAGKLGFERGDARLFEDWSRPYSRLHSISLSPDGRYALAGEESGLFLWDVHYGMKMGTLWDATGIDIHSVAISADGVLGISGSDDATVRIWNLQEKKEIVRMVGFRDGEWAVMTPDGRFDASPSGMKALYYVQGRDVLPLESFFDKFFTPGLLAKVISGTLPPLRGDQIDFSKPIKLPPLVKIVSPQTGDIFHTNQIQLKVEVSDQGGGIDEIRVSQNNKVIKVERKEAQPLAATRIYPIKLVADENTIRVTGFNNDWTESIPAVIVVNLEATQPISDMYIIAVGIDNYNNARYQLQYARADADAFVQAIERKGGGRFKTILKTILYDNDAVKEKILQAFQDVAQQASEEDVFVFYYSGHGVMSEATDSIPEDFFLVLQDIEKQYGANELLRERGISARALKDLCFKIKAQKQLIVIDACHTGGLIETFALKGASEEKAIYELARNAGIHVLAASNEEQTAKEISSIQHGVFTYSLLEGLNCHPGLVVRDGLVWISDLEKFAEKRVEEITRIYSATTQRPMCWTFKNDFPVAVCR